MSTGIRKSILIVDDDIGFRNICGKIAEDFGYSPVFASDGIEALSMIESMDFSLVLLDLRMPKMGGIDVLYHISAASKKPPIIIITGYGSIDSAVESMKLGAVDYIVKPSSVSEIKKIVHDILKKWKPTTIDIIEHTSYGRFGMIGLSRAMVNLYEKINILKDSDSTVMIIGESGVGKELVAKAIHYYGRRADEPFIPIDCSILSLTIVDSELFGHLRGSFTDAKYDKDGLLKLAGKGTVFFDEITEVPLPAQAKLLRAIQEKEFRPVGGSKSIKMNARIIAATNRNLEEAVREGRFREDLFYRLHVIPLYIPPLRERKEDIPLLVDYFLKKYSTERKKIAGITPEALETLKSYSWPGNVRELENVIQQIITFCESEWVRVIDLPPKIRNMPSISGSKRNDLKTLKEIEREAIIEALRLTGGNRRAAARMLGIGKTTLYEKIKKYRIE